MHPMSQQPFWRPMIGILLCGGAVALYLGGAILHYPTVCLTSWPLFGIGMFMAWR